MNKSLSKTWLQYEAGKDYKRRIGLYETVRQNERFYRGDQWYGVDSAGLPKPVFNVVKRITDYLTSSVTPSQVSVQYLDESIPYCRDENDAQARARLSKVLTDNANYRWERSGMDAKIFRLVRDAAISGDGVLYCYWKHDEAGDGLYEGDICTDIIDNVNLFVSDVNKSDIQSQDYIILSGRASVVSLKREARENGISEDDIARIVADSSDARERAADASAIELEGDDEAKATYLIKFWKEDGVVCFEKSTRGCIINRARTPCKLYPVAYFNWNSTKSSFHGTSAVSGLIANQKYINRSYAMVMKHMSDTAFSKVIYDKSKIPEWSNEVGEAIGAIGTANVSDAVAVLGVGKLQDEYLEFLDNVISVTKELGGATDTALGNVTPVNTSAILAIQEASKIPLSIIRSSLYQCIEELASIWADMLVSYCPPERLLPVSYSDGKLFAESIGNIGAAHLRTRIEITDTSAYNTSLTISILDKLLDGGHITASQYMDLLPHKYVPNFKDVLERSEENVGK